MKQFLDGTTPVSLHIKRQNDRIQSMHNIARTRKSRYTLPDLLFALFLAIGYAGVIHWLIIFIESLST